MAQNVTIEQLPGQITTNGVETFPLVTYNLPQLFSARASFTVIAKDLSSGDTYVQMANFAVKRGSGAGVVVGEVVDSLPPQSDPSMSTAGISVDVSGASLSLSVTGIDAKEIAWWARLDITGIQTN